MSHWRQNSGKVWIVEHLWVYIHDILLPHIALLPYIALYFYKLLSISFLYPLFFQGIQGSVWDSSFLHCFLTTNLGDNWDWSPFPLVYNFRSIDLHTSTQYTGTVVVILRLLAKVQEGGPESLSTPPHTVPPEQSKHCPSPMCGGCELPSEASWKAPEVATGVLSPPHTQFGKVAHDTWGNCLCCTVLLVCIFIILFD